MRKFLPLFLVLLLPLAACGDNGTETRIPSATGTWAGAISGFAFNMTLNEVDQNITGSGSLSGATGSPIPFTATGTHVHPNVSLTFRATGFQDINFQGSFTNDNTMTGILSGAGFANTPVTLNRT